MISLKYAGYWANFKPEHSFLATSIDLGYLRTNLLDLNLFGYRYSSLDMTKRLPSFYARVENFNQYQQRVPEYANSIVALRDSLAQAYSLMHKDAQKVKATAVTEETATTQVDEPPVENLSSSGETPTTTKSPSLIQALKLVESTYPRANKSPFASISPTLLDKVHQRHQQEVYTVYEHHEVAKDQYKAVSYPVNFFAPEHDTSEGEILIQTQDSGAPLRNPENRWAALGKNQLSQAGVNPEIRQLWDLVNQTNVTIPFKPTQMNTWSYLVAQENVLVNSYLNMSLDYYVDKLDVAAGLQSAKQIIAEYNNYFQFPTYAAYLVKNIFKHFPTLQEVKDSFAKWQAKRTPELRQRKFYISMIASHDRVREMPGVRNQILNSYYEVFDAPHVLLPGTLGNNTQILKNQYDDNKLKFLEDCFVNICPENTWGFGYVTEKVWDSIIAGCVPVYWGDLASEEGILNPEAIIIYNPRNRTSFQKEMFKLFTDKEFSEQKINTPVFLPGAAQRFYCRYIYPWVHLVRRNLSHNPSILVGNSNTDPASYHYEVDYLQAQQELLELEQELELVNEHIINDEFQWPFTSSAKRKLMNFTQNLDKKYGM